MIVPSRGDSGHKVRTHSAGEVLGMMVRTAAPSIQGGREGLEIWYGEQREDPSGGGGPGRTGVRDKSYSLRSMKKRLSHPSPAKAIEGASRRLALPIQVPSASDWRICFGTSARGTRSGIGSDPVWWR